MTCGGTTTTFNLSSDGTPQTVSNIPYGTNCSVVEPTPPVPPNACPPNTTGTWAIMATPTSISWISATTTTVTVTNTLTCTPGGQGGNGVLIVKKAVVSPGAIPVSAATYPVNVTCGGTTTTFNLSSDGTPQTVSNIP